MLTLTMPFDQPYGGFRSSIDPLPPWPSSWAGAKARRRLHQLLAQGVLTRFGPLFQIERAGGQFVLAAIAVPRSALTPSAWWSTAFPKWRAATGAHALNYVVRRRRRDRSALAADAIARIQDVWACRCWRFPREEYFVELRLPALADRRRSPRRLTPRPR